jgi:hypothetical protein
MSEAQQKLIDAMIAGGPEAARIFLRFAQAHYEKDGVEGLFKWVDRASKLLPRPDLIAVISSLIEEVVDSGLMEKVLT